jgi:sugar/nucleoside kinase (ribokinase family)
VTPSIVLLGNLLVDDVVLADGTTRMAQAGGALLYGALAATLWNARPGLVSVLGTDYPVDVLQMLRQRGVDLAGLHALGHPGVRTWLLYEGANRRMIHRMGCPTHEDVSPQPRMIPTEWHGARAFHLAPMPFDVQRTLIASLSGVVGRFVSVDPLLPVTTETLHEWREVLANVDAFFPGEDEILFDAMQTNPPLALSRLANGRLRFIVFKRGAKGGTLYDAHERRCYDWTTRADVVVDETGAGDAFSSAFVLAHLEGQPIEACLQRAVVTASFALAGWGPEALLAATRSDADARLRSWYAAGIPGIR